MHTVYTCNENEWHRKNGVSYIVRDRNTALFVAMMQVTHIGLSAPRAYMYSVAVSERNNPRQRKRYQDLQTVITFTTAVVALRLPQYSPQLVRSRLLSL